MDMFNKIRSAVSSALPGIPLSKDFDIAELIASGGPGLSWRIFNGVKRTTKQEAAVFVFEKRSLERYSKRDKEIIIESLKRGVSQLTRLRHPKILSVLHPLEESRETLAFATEPVFSSLANVLGDHGNLPNIVPRQLAEYSLYEVEIKHGLLQVAEGMSFLHNDVKLLHSNICPENIIINKNGCWKLFGFDCCVANSNTQDQSPLFTFREWDPEMPPVAQPNLDYLAPEYALTMNCSLASDMFSIGVLMHTLFNKGKSLYECSGQLSQFKKYAEELRKFRSSLLGSVPNELHEYVKLLLNTEPTVRPDADQLSKIPFFDDVGCMTLQFMDSLFQRNNQEKSQFFKGLPKIIEKMPKRVNLQRILPPLGKECVNPDMVPFVLPNVLQIAEQSTDKEYLSQILPLLIPMFKLREPPQIPLILMQNMTLLLKKTPQGDIKSYVLPMIHLCLEADSPQLQELCLSIIPTFAELIEFSALKNSIIPRIKKLCLSTGLIAIRTNCLLCIGKLLEFLDKWTVLDDILPLLPQIPSREPAILMSILGIFQVTLTHVKLGITKDILANKVLPFVIPLAIDNNLNLQQFNAYMSVIRDMLGRMEKDQLVKLEQLDQMKQEQRTLEITKITSSDDKQLVTGVDEGQQSMMDKFLTGFGISSMMGGGKSSPQKPNSHSPALTRHVATAEVVKVEDENPQAAIPVSQPSKTLSLEEKQKLAKQQEQQRLYKVQKPLNTTKSTSSGTIPQHPAKTQSSGVKDLTSSLMNSNMMGISTPSQMNKSSASMNQSGMNMTGSSMSSLTGRAMGSNSSSVFGSPNTMPTSGASNRTMGQSSMNPNSFGTSGTMGMGQTSLGMTGMGQSSLGMSSGMAQSPMGLNPNSSMTMGQSNKPGQKIDMSAFDSLMSSTSSQQPKMSLNQMSQQTNRPVQQQNSTSNQWSMMGNNMTVPMGNMGQSSGMMGMTMGNSAGNPNMGQFTGGQQGLMQNPMGMQNMMQPMGSQFQQPISGQGFQPIGSQGISNNSSSNDISDIFG